MKKLALTVALIMLINCLIGCTAGGDNTSLPSESPSVSESAVPSTETETVGAGESVDYAISVQPSGSDTAKQEVTVKSFVDGDTVHFHIPEEIIPSGVLKARFLGIDTPESTGKIEEYGKAAADYTKQKLSEACSILIESDDASWNIDSTGGRYLVWVWYKAQPSDEYRNLNIELLQTGLARANSSANNRYGSACTAAISQARANKLNIYSGERDPNFYYGDAIELTLKELRCNIESYNGIKVAFEGNITMNSGNGVFIEDYDAESGLYFGISAYYGYGLNGAGLDILSVGNRARIVGTVQYYETGGYYQVSGLSYRQMKSDDPSNIQKLSEGNSAAYTPVSVTELASSVSIETESGTMELILSDIMMNTTVQIAELTVESFYRSDDGDSATLNCTSESESFAVRLEALKLNGEETDLDALIGKTISVRGVLDSFNGEAQVHVFTNEGITIQ